MENWGKFFYFKMGEKMDFSDVLFNKIVIYTLISMFDGTTKKAKIISFLMNIETPS